MKKKLQKISMAVAAVVLFGCAMLLSIERSDGGSLMFVTTSSFANGGGQESGGGTSPKSCFVRTTSKCPTVAGQGGGERVTCDLSGYYVQGSTCTPVKCVTGAGSKQECSTT